MYPFSFDKFLMAQGLETTVSYKHQASPSSPLPDAVHNKLVEQLKTFYLVGGMPAAVTEWIASKSYIECAHVHNDIRTPTKMTLPSISRACLQLC